jgi:uncharacterized protein YggU (UPF0235/DUF167 family)
MRIAVRVKAGSKNEKVERITQPSLELGYKEELPLYKVEVKARAIHGKANEAVVRALAEYFDTAPSLIKLISGHKNKAKVFEIL